MTESPEDRSEDSEHRRRKRWPSSRSFRRPKRPSGQPPLLSRMGARLSRRGKVIACVTVGVAAVVFSVLAHQIETAEIQTHNTMVSAVGFAPATFVAVLAGGTLLLAQAVGYKRKRLWITTSVLIVFLVLQAVAWQHAYSLAHDTLEPQIIGDPDNPNPSPVSSPASMDIYIMVLYTVGVLCSISAVLTMRRVVRWATPSEASKRLHSQAEGDAPESAPTGEDGPAEEGEPRELEADDAELQKLDAMALPASSAEPAPEAEANTGPAKRRAQRLFE
jgi:hypothetical protein